MSRLPRLTAEAHRELARLARSSRAPHRLVLRSRIVLLSYDGRSVAEIARACGCTRPTVRLWQRRYAEAAVAGLESDAAGRGRPRALTDDVRATIAGLQPEPTARQRVQTLAAVAATFGVSPSTVRRIWRSAGRKDINGP